MFAMLLRTLISEGRIVHQTTVEDPGSHTGRRVERIVREGPITLVITTTGELHAENETRMLSFYISESQEQTRGVIDSLAARAAGIAGAPADLAPWHDLQRWIALGPNDVIIPFAPQIAAKIPPRMVRFRRDVDALFSFIKASAILHQAQRKIDDRRAGNCHSWLIMRWLTRSSPRFWRRHLAKASPTTCARLWI